ncbi:MAG: MBL fold metallo-hydrolase [Deltaproteobacteria bacterium]|nr:MBL fold metallo-hydrolase [Deltaproteobacteria bacterium]MBW2308474.1 MBL fold metallo-hydrolase [Deltaproteobacteria bacterium]
MKNAQSMTITTLVDNYVTTILPTVDYASGSKERLLAEHGLALLVEVKDDEGARHVFLLDAGGSQTTFLYNADRMKVDPRQAEFLVVSHGHWDHTGSVIPIIQRSRKELPVLVHPEAFRERWRLYPDGTKAGPRLLDRSAWERVGARLVVKREVGELFPGCFLTGEIPRNNPYETTPEYARYRKGDELVHDDIPDDQAVVVILRDRGLVILTGCAHSGIVNTMHYARTVTGIDRIWAVMGGFHLGEASQERMDWTIKELKAATPRFVIPTHCTGFYAQAAMARAMPDAYFQNTVGTAIHFS